MAWADALHLANHETLEGIIVWETDARIKVQIAWTGYVTLERVVAVEIVRGSADEHERLLVRWHEEFLSSQARERERRAFDTAQREQGLVKYRGQWVTPEELAFIREEVAREAARWQRQRRERKQLEEELNRLAQRLQALEEENQRLRNEASRQRVVIAPSGFFLHDHLVFKHHDSNLVRDEHGNLLQVSAHEGHRFVTMPTGEHVDLQGHGGHLAFTDDEGIHHDLDRVRH
jgi:hypothetical protein